MNCLYACVNHHVRGKATNPKGAISIVQKWLTALEHKKIKRPAIAGVASSGILPVSHAN